MFSSLIKSCYGSNFLRKVIEHPFNVELMNNTLNVENFKFYVQQDALFLDDYIRTVLIVASRVEDHNNIVPLIDVTQGAIDIRKVLYNHYFGVYNISRGEKSLACFNFTNFLLSISYSNVYEAVTVLYSCHFIYYVAINGMKNGFKKNNRYKDWLDFFSSNLVDRYSILENMVDEYCSKANEKEKSRMLELFKICAQLELDFWDSAYNFSKFNTESLIYQG